MWSNDTHWDILSKCKTFQCDSGALSNRDHFGELDFDLWLVFTHHTCRNRKVQSAEMQSLDQTLPAV